MRTDFYFDSCGAGKIHCCKWTPEENVKAVIQIVHGIAEYIERYDEFAGLLNLQGILVVAEDHMGHGKSVDNGGTRGYFDGGWDAAIRDTLHLTELTRQEYPDVPYFIFGHSMGSFMTRTILWSHPEIPFTGCILSGTGWMPLPVIRAGRLTAMSVCSAVGEKNPSERLQNMMFAGYNKRVEHKRTEFDWLTREDAVVDAYIAHPMCGFTASCGLLRDMLGAMEQNQKMDHLKKMNPELPVLFVAGGDDPVGSYGKGVRTAAHKFGEAGIRNVNCRIFPLCRHEILNERNRGEIYSFIFNWIENIMKNQDNLEK